MTDRPMPEPTDPEIARAALRKHSVRALENCDYEYDGDRTIYLTLPATDSRGETQQYLVRLTFLYYPDWPPSVTFLNPLTRRYDGTHWPSVTSSPRLAMHVVYGGAPTGMVCNSMTFEYYFWGGHSPTDIIKWNKARHTFFATIAELKDHLQVPYYQGRSS
jgi:hypothetical protein